LLLAYYSFFDIYFPVGQDKVFDLVSKALENLKIEIVLLLLLNNWRLVSGPPNYRMQAAKNAGRNQLIFREHRQDGLSLYVHRQNAQLPSVVCLTIF
jgi:hypothetical protein